MVAKYNIMKTSMMATLEMIDTIWDHADIESCEKYDLKKHAQ